MATLATSTHYTATEHLSLFIGKMWEPTTHMKKHGYQKDYSIWGFRWLNVTKTDEKGAVPLIVTIHQFLHRWLTLQILASKPGEG